MEFSKERSKLLELKAEYCLDEDYYIRVYKKSKSIFGAMDCSDYIRGKRQVKMIDLLLDWGKIGYNNGTIDLSHKDEKFIKKWGINGVYAGLVRNDWMTCCICMSYRDDIYGQMVKKGIFNNIHDEEVRDWTILGLLAGYAHIAPKDPMIEKILNAYDLKGAPTSFVKTEQSRGLKELKNGKWERNARYYHYITTSTGDQIER